MPTVDPKYLSQLRYRCIGPTRGGRVVAVAADPKQQAVFYFGACAGGVWKSTDAGTYWENVSDGFFETSSVGALAVAPSDGNVIYAGMGEATIRIDVSHGDGVYKSTDAGVTWRHMGLAESRHIGEIRIHPNDPDLVYVAALGHMSKDNPERGLYRSRDGGENWELVLHVGDDAGAVDVSLDPEQPADRVRHHLADAPQLLVDQQRRPALWALALTRRRRHVGGHQRAPRHAGWHARQDRCVGVAGPVGSGVRDRRGRVSQARRVPLR